MVPSNPGQTDPLRHALRPQYTPSAAGPPEPGAAAGGSVPAGSTTGHGRAIMAPHSPTRPGASGRPEVQHGQATTPLLPAPVPDARRGRPAGAAGGGRRGAR